MESGKFLLSTCPPLVYLPSLAIRENSSIDEIDNSPTLLTIQPKDDIGNESKQLLDLFDQKTSKRLDPSQFTTAKNGRGEASQQKFGPSELLVEMKKGYRFAHFGTHGAASLTGAYLELGDLGKLTVLDILNAFNRPSNQLRTELVLLSACETQVVDNDSVRFGGNTIKAMGTAFLVAGAENVIASHWRVNDVSTTPLVATFMEKVKRFPKPKLSADDYASILHATRRGLANQEAFKHPYDWGPFTLSTILTGNERRLSAD